MKKCLKILILSIILIVVFSICIIYFPSNFTNEISALFSKQIIREPAVAGAFYPSSEQELNNILDLYLQKAEKKDLQNIKALIIPHAGYIYSGQTAATAYKQLNDNIKTVIILAPSHHFFFNGASVSEFTHYKTPLGLVKLNKKTNQLLKKQNMVPKQEAHIKEHSLEVQLPFLQKTLKDFEIIPIITSNISPEELASILLEYIDDSTLVIASSDLSHYHPYEKAIQLDSICLNSIINLDFKKMEYCEACGKTPILTLMHIAEKLNWHPTLLDYKNSGDTAGNKQSVVGYTSIAFSQQKEIPEQDKKFLLKLARSSLNSYLKDKTLPEINEKELPPILLQKQGCFVTLNKNKQLRGCIGHILPQESLYKCVITNTINAALNDIRFSPVLYPELEDIDIEISILSLPEELKFTSQEDLLSKLKPEVHGVVLQNQNKQSTYLPQVWLSLKDKKEFLASLCLKQNSPSNCWQDKTIKIFTYTADVFDE